MLTVAKTTARKLKPKSATLTLVALGGLTGASTVLAATRVTSKVIISLQSRAELDAGSMELTTSAMTAAKITARKPRPTSATSESAVRVGPTGETTASAAPSVTRMAKLLRLKLDLDVGSMELKTSAMLVVAPRR